MSLIEVTRTYSDIDMACPSDWENGYKEGLVNRFGAADRMLSDPRTGERGPATMDIEFIDDRRFREQLAGRLTAWPASLAWTVKMTNRATRAAKGDPYVVWVGPHVASKPTWGGQKRGWKVTLGDIFTRTLAGAPAKDRGQIPWRKIGDNGILAELTTISESLNRETPESIIYGPHVRVLEDTDPPSPQGYCIVPTYLGLRDLGGNAYHAWFLCGHALYSVPFWRVHNPADDTNNDYGSEGSQWKVPQHANHTAQFGAVYEDIVDVFGRTRRCSILYGLVTDMFAKPEDMTDPDACAAGVKQLSVAVHGTETAGDGSGDEITDGFDQRLHFMVNHVANIGSESYHSGPYLANPTWNVYGVPVKRISESSHAAAKAIALERLPPDGYLRSAVIGRTSSDRNAADYWRAAWDRSLGCMSGPNRFCQDVVKLCHPTIEDKEAAELYTDATEILLDTFDVDVRWPLHTNALPFRADYNPSTGVWMTTDTATWDPSIDAWDQIDSEAIEYPFTPGITQAFHIAHLEVIRSQHPPVFIELQTTIVEQDTSSLAYKDLGDYIRYRHVASVSTGATEIRLAQIIAIQVQVGARRVKALAVDVEDLIGFDLPAT